MKKTKGKTSLKIILFIFLFLLAPKAYAASVTLVPSKDSVGVGEQFSVDVMLDPQNVNINGVEGRIAFSQDNVSFVQAESGRSLISLWIEEPKIKDGAVSFSGIIPNGFEGVIDPFNQKQKLPGLITRLIFKTKEAGVATFSPMSFSVAENNGKGSLLSVESVDAYVKIEDANNKTEETKNEKEAKPELNAYVVQDQNLFDGKYTLVFQAKDTGDGIKEVLIKEGSKDWKKITSPYLLEDQSRQSQITLKAVNFSGVDIVKIIEPLPSKFFTLKNILLLIISILVVIFIVLFWVRKRDKKTTL